MTTQEAIDYYGSARAVAEALNITRQAVSQWGETVPALSAYRLEALTEGALKAGEYSYE